MTAADKLRELLATRPEMPNTEQLFSWWQTSGELLEELLGQKPGARAAWNTALDELAENLVVTCHAMKHGPIPASYYEMVARLHQLAVVLADTRKAVRRG